LSGNQGRKEKEGEREREKEKLLSENVRMEMRCQRGYFVSPLLFEKWFPTRKNGFAPAAAAAQGCQTFLGITYQNGKILPNYCKIYQKATK
jgi:hypothetical protein